MLRYKKKHKLFLYVIHENNIILPYFLYYMVWSYVQLTKRETPMWREYSICDMALGLVLIFHHTDTDFVLLFKSLILYNVLSLNIGFIHLHMTLTKLT